MKAVAIGGIPATGKSTLMKAILKHVGVEQKFACGLLRGYLKGDTAFLGLYPSGDKFGGTDKLSMAVQKDYERFLEEFDYNIIFEGDRLFTLKNLISLRDSHDARVIVLDNNPMTIAHRHIDREDNQSEKFIKGRVTKILNIIKSGEVPIEKYELNNLQETRNLAEDISGFLGLSPAN